MKGTVGRLARLLAGNLVKILSLLLAVSLIAFVLVTASPVDPVQQYILGLGTAVSPEQRAQIEAYWGVDQPPCSATSPGSPPCCTGTWASPRSTGGRWRRSLPSGLEIRWR